MKHIHTTLGGLATTVVSPDENTHTAVILCHGYGAGGDDLVPLGAEVARRMAGPHGPGIRFYFPEAPLLADVGGGGRAWWQLEPERLLALSRGEIPVVGARRREVPEGLTRARRMLMALLDEVQRQCALPLSRVVLGGFSQGAMLTTDVTLRLEEAPAGLMVLSGTLICEEDWSAKAAQRRGLPVMMSHGRQDPLLPFDDAEALRGLLAERGLDVDFHPFNGPHTIPFSVLTAMARFLERVAPPG
ncbi:MAG: phospholipase [Myxococcota bacterium]